MTVGALRHRRIFLMGDNLNAVKRAEILIAAVMLALIHCTFNAHIRFAIVHFHKPALLQNNSEAQPRYYFVHQIQIYVSESTMLFTQFSITLAAIALRISFSEV